MDAVLCTVNLVAIMMLSGVVAKLTRDYFDQKRKGAPRFDPDQYPELEGRIDREIWRR